MSLVATSGGDALILARTHERAGEAARQAEAAPPAAAATPMTGRAEPVLRLEGICLSFGGITALDGIDLAVAKGEIRAIIGPNGAGKSSLLNVVSGLYRPSRGVVRLGHERFVHV